MSLCRTETLPNPLLEEREAFVIICGEVGLGSGVRQVVCAAKNDHILTHITSREIEKGPREGRGRERQVEQQKHYGA